MSVTPYRHPDYLAQFAGVIAAPADDLPRLVLADWLDENGETERAEFIRVQCELAKVEEYAGGDCPGCLVASGDTHLTWCRVTANRKREAELVALRHPERSNEHWLSSWLCPNGRVTVSGGLDHVIWYPPAPRTEAVHCHVRRGFVAGAWFYHLSDWYGAWETVETTNLAGETTETPTLFVPGVGHQMVKTFPVEYVQVRDREPMRLTEGDREEWFWVRHDAGMDPHEPGRPTHYLPAEIWRRLGGYERSPTARVRARRYSSEAKADAALSDALLTWAKGPPTGSGTEYPDADFVPLFQE